MKAKVAAFQLTVQKEKKDVFERIEKRWKELEEVDFFVLPEMFNCPYDNSLFEIYAEEQGEETYRFLQQMAGDHHCYVVGGSVPEICRGKLYNTSYVFDRSGKEIAKHRKVHLFDIDVEGGQSFQESKVLSAGNAITTFETEFGKMGLCICYDFRFPEMARIMALNGAKAIFVPAAFNMTTGPAHWEILFRTRALDNQVYTVGAAPARDRESSYTSWGHSIVVDPWGKIVESLEEREDLLKAEIDFDRVQQVRRELPLLAHRRKDLYLCQEKNTKKDLL